MRLRKALLPLACIAAMIFALAGCTSSQPAPPLPAPAPAISVAFVGTPPSLVQAGVTTQLTALVSNDSSNAGVDWSVTCGGAGACGSFSPTHTASGSATTYTAPATVPSGNTVTISATSTADKTKLVPVTVTITVPPPITVSFVPPPSTLQTNATAMLTAVVSNDASNGGVDWSATCGSAGACGSFSPNHTASGSATTYTAPAAAPSGDTVTITVTSTADNTKSDSTNITIGTAQNTLLNGSYTFLLSGFDADGPYSIAGRLTADGAGNINSGEQDYSDFFVASLDSFTGTYSIGPDGRGTIKLNTGDSSLPNNFGTETLGIVIVSVSHAFVTEFDSGATSSGTMDAQTVPSGGFSTATLSGGYSFVISGIDVNTAVALGWGGVMNIDSPPGISGAGSISDINDGGTVSTSQALTGSVVSVDPLGRADILLNVGSFAGVEVIAYIADAAHLKLVEIDGVLGVAGGTAIGQGTNTGTFTSNAAQSGTLVFGTQGTSIFGPTATGGLFTADGAGNVVSGVFDNNAGGGTFNGSVTGTYSVDTSATGRGTVSLEILIGDTGMLSTFAFYLSGDGSPPMLLELDSNSVTTGTAFQQAAGPFTAASFTGPHGLNFTDFDEFGDEFDATARAVADGTGSLVGTADVNSIFTFFAIGANPVSNIPLTGAFTANANGRFTGTLNVPQTGSIDVAFYIVDSTRVLFIETDTAGVTLGKLELQQSVP